MFISLSKIRKLCNRSKSKRWNCVLPSVMSLLFCQQAMTIVYLSSVLFGKLSASNPNASVSGVLVISPLNTRSTASSKNYSIEYELTERDLSAVHLKDFKNGTFTSVKPDIHLKLSTAISANMLPQLDDLLNSRFKFCISNFRNNF